MKKDYFPFLFLFFFSQCLFAQQNLPIIKATSTETYFLEGKQSDKRNWWLDPAAKPDVYKIDKASKIQNISFHTDIESLKIKIRPGEKYDFIVLLNGKDSCYTQILSDPPINKYKNQTPPSHDTIPFKLTDGNNIKIKVCLNKKDTLDLYFDSGGTDLVIAHEAIATKTNLLKDKKEGFKTRDYVRFNSRNSLQIGKTTWDDLEIYPVTHRGQGTDGSFGWNLFDGRILEFDYDKNIMIIHSSLPKKIKGYSKLKIEYINTLFCVEGKLFAKGKKYKSRYLFDTGYQRAILLDSVLVQEQNFPRDLPIIKTTTLRNGVGKVFYTKIVNAQKIKLGNSSAFNIPTQLLDTDNPARFKTHILGNELLKRYNTILDFQKDCVYLKPNSLMTLPYTDAS